jgi:FkbM family methyltransferase
MKPLFKKLYAILPFKKEIFSVLRAFPLPYKIIKHLYFNDNFKVRISKKYEFLMHHYGFQLENELFWYGINGWEKHSLSLWIEKCKGGDIIFDIGANTGVYALMAQTINPNANIYAFEPVQRVYEKLLFNVQLNSYPINTFSVAISDKTGTTKIWDYNGEHEYGASLTEPETKCEQLISYNVQTISLDDFIEKNQIAKIDLIKIDVEAFEPKVLDGYAKYFSVHKPILLIEILYNHIGEQVQRFIEASMVKYDYFFIDEEKGLVKVKDIRRYSDKYFNYLLVPLFNPL